MKNYQYVKDGLLESYLLGAFSESEQHEARQLIATDPELAVELEEIERGMEAYFMQEAVPPPPGVRMALQERLFGGDIQTWQSPEDERHRQPPQPEPARSPYIDVEVSDTHLRVHKYWRPAFIAVFVLSKIFLILGLYFYFKAASLEQEVVRLKAVSPAAQPLPQMPR